MNKIKTSYRECDNCPIIDVLIQCEMCKGFYCYHCIENHECKDIMSEKIELKIELDDFITLLEVAIESWKLDDIRYGYIEHYNQICEKYDFKDYKKELKKIIEEEDDECK